MSAATAISVRAFHSPGVSTLSPTGRGIERVFGTALPPQLDPSPPVSQSDARSLELDPPSLLPKRRREELHGRTPARHQFTDPTPPKRSLAATFVDPDGRIHAGRIDVRSMSMTPKPVRFSAWQWEVVAREAAANAVSTAEFVRAAALAAAVISARRRGAGDTVQLEALLLRALDRDDS